MRAAIAAVFALAVAACGSVTPSDVPTATAQPSPLLSTATFVVPDLTSGSMYTAPPYEALPPVSGISIRVVDKSHFEVSNSSGRDYYFKVITWTTEDNLVCGRGVSGHDGFASPVLSGTTVEAGGGSTVDVPITVEIWDHPCGDACTDPSVGEALVPISLVDPPMPGST